MAATFEGIEQFIQAAGDARSVACSDIAALAWVTYDIALTLPRERRAIWNTKRSPITWMFVFLRYYSLLDLAFIAAVDTNFGVKYNTSLCTAVLWIKGTVALTLPIFIAEALMVIRVWALYHKDRRMLVFLGCLYSIRVVMGTWACIVETITVHVPTYTFPIPLPSCLGGTPAHVYYSLITSSVNLAVSATLFALTLLRLFLGRRALAGGGTRIAKRGTSLVHLLVRDGSIYFLMLLAAEVMFVVFVFVFPGRIIRLVGFPWMVATYCVGATRVTLNLRESAMGADDDDDRSHSYGNGGRSGPQFVVHVHTEDDCGYELELDDHTRLTSPSADTLALGVRGIHVGPLQKERLRAPLDPVSLVRTSRSVHLDTIAFGEV